MNKKQKLSLTEEEILRIKLGTFAEFDNQLRRERVLQGLKRKRLQKKDVSA